ncbi:MAG: hypothetical protein ACREPT_07555 [Rudaea sp.]
MTEIVIDTNVLLVANGDHFDVSPECVTACVQRLQHAKKQALIIVDDGYRILSEYQNKLNPNRGKGVGDVFLKWLLQQHANTNHVLQVHLTDHGTDQLVIPPLFIDTKSGPMRQAPVSVWA